jgi:two-component system, NtrC family, nitrogen regulation sensor histidine kinase NtrY
MSFRQKLLLLFAATVFLCVAVVSISVYGTIQRSFGAADRDRSDSVAAQFRAEFEQQGAVVTRKVDSVAASDLVQRIALDMNRGAADSGEYVNSALMLAGQHQLDFLELVDSHGTIISSAQWPAKFGYAEPVLGPAPASTRSAESQTSDGQLSSDRASADQPPADSSAKSAPSETDAAFLKREELPERVTLGLFAIRAVRVAEQALYVIGGERLDQGFLSSLDIPGGTRVLLYQNLDAKWNPKFLLDLNGPAAGGDQLAPLVAEVRESHKEAQSVIHWSADPADAEVVHAIPLTGPGFADSASTHEALSDQSATTRGKNTRLLGVLLVGSSRRPLIELKRQIISTAMLVGGVGILIAVLASLWFAARVTRPVVSLADAARRVAAGDLSAKVDVETRDELGELAASFNRMTTDLVQQKDRTLQAERVAAWRELARRLAHELKNPLFPLQVTVENLKRAKEKSPALFEEVFHESTATLLEEIENLKTIISRFSEFSRMPQPERRAIQLNEIVQSVLRTMHAQLQEKKIAVRTALDPALPMISADPDLLHRALQNLVLNAIDAMPAGGELTMRTSARGNSSNGGASAPRPGFGGSLLIEVSDTGSGLTSAECERLFTPYYTTKAHGTGLGLAIVQSVVSDHGGKISVESAKEKGATFRIELPL